LTKAERNYSTTERECLAIVWATTKFRPYLYGRHFTSVSDHHSLCWLTSLKDPLGRLARWGLRLQEFDYVIVYKSGKKHLAPDALSRCPLASTSAALSAPCPHFVATLDDRSHADVVSYQRSDSRLRPIIDFLSTSPLPATTPTRRRWQRCYTLHDDLLYRVVFDSINPLRLVIPAAMRSAILEYCHDIPQSGHLGFMKTYERLRSSYYWQGMQNSVARYIRSCLACQRRKPPPHPRVGHLQPIEPPRFPFHCVGIDFLGPFPLSSAGNRYIIVAVDYLSRFAETKAVPAADSRAVASFFLHRLVLRHGAPSVLLSDRGRPFIARFLSDFLQQCATLHKTTTAYHPQCNGLTERFHHKLSDMLSMYVNTCHDNWDAVLPYVTFAYNTSRQASTGHTKFYLVYARDPRTTLDSILRRPSAGPHTCASDYLDNALAARDLARRAIITSQRRQSSAYNSTRRVVSYSPGEYVWVSFPFRQPGLAEKLLQRYFGPYVVLRQTGPVNFEVSRLPLTDSSSREVVHVARLKPFYERAPE
jgi:hypothetical protein